MYRYAVLEEKGFFDASLPTTSTKQATANILAMLGIKINFDFKLPTRSTTEADGGESVVGER